jgi:hypothetical protein
MVLIMIITGLLRHATSSILKSSKQLPGVDRANKSVLMRTSRLRMSGGFICRSRWESRRAYWTAKDKGGLREGGGVILAKPKDDPAAGGMPGMPNPAASMEGMMGNASFMVQNMVMMQGIQHFFSGYVLLKVPFPLTRGFKGMFQRGVDLPTLETSYVSSVSWYFLVMYGLRGMFRLIIGDPSPETRDSNMLQLDLGNTLQAQQPFKPEPLFKAECENLEIAKYRSVIESSEKLLLGKLYPKPKLNVNTTVRKSGKNAGDDIFSMQSSEPKLVDETKKAK